MKAKQAQAKKGTYGALHAGVRGDSVDKHTFNQKRGRTIFVLFVTKLCLLDAFRTFIFKILLIWIGDFCLNYSRYL